MAILSRAAVGLVQLPSVMVEQDIACGELMAVLPQGVPRCGVVDRVFPFCCGLLPTVHELIDYLAAELLIGCYQSGSRIADSRRRNLPFFACPVYGRFVEVFVWRLPESLSGSTHSFKYRLAYVVASECVLRYDNELGKGDHRHVGAREMRLALEGARAKPNGARAEPDRCRSSDVARGCAARRP